MKVTLRFPLGTKMSNRKLISELKKHGLVEVDLWEANLSTEKAFAKHPNNNGISVYLTKNLSMFTNSKEEKRLFGYDSGICATDRNGWSSQFNADSALVLTHLFDFLEGKISEDALIREYAV